MDNRAAVLCRTQNRLAPGRQVRVEWRDGRPVLVLPDGTVQLNESAANILELCDGTRTADEIIAQYVPDPSTTELASDGREFLEAAVARGWIVEI